MKAEQHPYAGAEDSAGPGWSYFGWQGWGLVCPQRWNPVVLGAVHEEGSAVLADLDVARLEITWRRPPRGSRVDLDRTIAEQAATMSGELSRHDLPQDEGGLLRRSRLLYHRQTCVAVAALDSSVTQRAAVVRLSLGGVDQPVEAARRILSSLRDYGHDQAVPWAVYDLAFWSPPGFGLTGKAILAGSTRMLFRGPGAVLSFWKVSALAGGLDGCDPAAWFARAGRKDRRWRRCSQQRQMVQEHEAQQITGQLPWYRWPGHWRRRQLVALCWACPQTERLFEVQAAGWTLDTRWLQQVAAGVVCHVP